MTVFDHFSIGRSAMRAFRLGMNISGYNVANSQTPGFSRRRIELGTLPVVEVPGGLSGGGVDVLAVRRLRDPFLDFATRRELGRLGADSGRTGVLSALEPAFGDVDNAELTNAFSSLFDSIEKLTTQPDNVSVREDVINGAQQLAATIRRTDTKLVEARTDADNRVVHTVERSNEILSRLAQINQALVEEESSGSEASDLRDERDNLTDELSSLVAVRTVETSNGTINVHLDETGDTLLSGNSPRPLVLTSNSEGVKRITISRGGESVDLTDRMRGGQLGGLLAVRDHDIPGYRTRLNALAASVITEFNSIHESGYDLNGDAGVNLFEPDPPGSNAASAIQVNDVIETDPRKLAVASAPGAPGKNEIALAMLGLRGAGLSALDSRSMVGFAADILASVGHDVAQSDASREASRAIVDSLDLKRRSMSGVSLDEEAADLVRWQQSFQAAAKFMQTVNQVTETAMSIFGG